MSTETNGSQFGRRSELRVALSQCRSAFVGVALLSGLLNVLYLTGSFFMLEVYDRVLPSRSVPTLVGLSLIALVLFLFQGCMDVIRSRILTRIGSALDETMSGRPFQAVARLPLITDKVDSMQPSRDLDTVRGFFSGLGLTALFDLPWMPLYLGLCFLFHPAIGWTALVGGLVLVAATCLTETLMRKPVHAASLFTQRRNALAETSRRNAEALRAMGMENRLNAGWESANADCRTAQIRAADISTALGTFSKTFRMALQSAVLAVGAYLVVNGEASAGIIIASSILTARALAPVELLIGHWKGFVGARHAWKRLSDVLAMIPPDAPQMELPQPKRSLALEAVSIVPPGGRAPIVHDVTFGLAAGQGLGVIGPSGSGKSSLIRAITGVWTPFRGTVRLDGATLGQWPPERLGAHIGYLPQDVQLFGGTVAENIARFVPDATPERIMHAAKAAGVHDMIVEFPSGYATEVGDAGQALSAGQRQRIGLARALFDDPFLVVLDEPNSNLDGEGEDALTEAILSVRRRGGIVVVIAHRPSALVALDTVLIMRNGRMQRIGPKDEVLGRAIHGPATEGLPGPVRPVLPSMSVGAAA